MTSSFDFNDISQHADDVESSHAPSPPSPGHHDAPPRRSRPSAHVTIFQTTGPDAHTGPILAPGGSGTPVLNPRSCVTCRRRKVRCDKQMPCSNCRRALIPCVFPAPGRAPRQQRPKDPNGPSKTSSQREVELVKRLKKLEGIVEELSGQIEIDATDRAPSTSGSPVAAHSDHDLQAARCTSRGLERTTTDSSGLGQLDLDNAPSSETGQDGAVQKNFGRLVLDDHRGTSRYVSSGFWSKLNDELDAIREETQKLTDEEEEDVDYDDTPSYSPTHGVATMADHHAFVWGYRSADVPLRKCHPPPSHATYLWSVYQENVEPLVKILHIPTTELVIRQARTDPEQLTPAHEAMVFAIYFAAVTSLEPDEVATNLAASKEAALAQYRFALEQALAKANFLDTSNLTVVQAFTIFLIVVRRHDESRFCWALTGLLIKIAQGLGLHRDGAHLKLSPFETELRRRLWWAIIMLDLRSSEELGTDMTVSERSYDTRMPSNINDTDIGPQTTEPPVPREGRSDCAVSLVRAEICALSRRLVSASSAMASLAPKTDEDSVAEKERLLIEVYQRVEHKFLQHVLDEADPLYWVAAMIARVVMGKMCLVIYHPVLFPGSDYRLSEEIRERIFVAAIEIIEYNHKLNTDARCKQYRWLFKTYTNWHAIAYTLIEACRRPWTALVERGWEAVNSYEKDPVQIARRADHAAVFLPLRKLFVRARKHRDAEIARLKADQVEARKLDFAERMNPAQARFGPVPGAENRMEQMREKWRLMIRPDGASPLPFNTRQPPSHAHGSSAVALRPPAQPQQPGRTLQPASTQVPTSIDLSSETMQYMTDFIAQPDVDLAAFWTVANSEGMTTSADVAGPAPAPEAQSSSMMGQSALRQQALTMATQPPQDEHVPPNLWSDPFTVMNTKFDEATGDDIDMLGDDFDWQDWSQSIRGLEMESTQTREGW